MLPREIFAAPTDNQKGTAGEAPGIILPGGIKSVGVFLHIST